ncbi:unnamed protein product, partial [Allacma fusca]
MKPASFFHLYLIFGLWKSSELINLRPLTDQFRNCMINIVQLTHPYDYRTINSPFKLRTYSSDRNRFLHFDQRPLTLLKESEIFKQRNIRCFIKIMLFAANSNSELKQFEGENNSFRTSVAIWTPESPLEYFFIFCQNLVETELLVTISLKRRLWFKHVPTFALFPKTEMYLQGFFICNCNSCHCDAAFDCSTLNCLDTIDATFRAVTNNGRSSMNWVIYSKLIGAYSSYKLSNSKMRMGPHYHKNPSNLYSTTIDYLTVDLDMNASSYNQSIEETIFVATPEKLSFHSEFRLSHTPSLNFITADNVTSEILEFNVYTTPFDFRIWLFLALSMLSLSLILTIDTCNWSLLAFALRLPSTLADLMANIVEQSGYMPKSETTIRQTKAKGV